VTTTYKSQVPHDVSTYWPIILPKRSFCSQVELSNIKDASCALCLCTTDFRGYDQYDMHGLRRKDYKERRRTSDESAKALKLRALESELLKRRRKSILHSASSSERNVDLDLTLNFLLVNPDPLWAWGYRRKLLLFNSEAESGDFCTRPLMPRIEDELNFTTTCLLKNPKSYGAWLHRKWLCVEHPARRHFWLSEMERTSSFLSKDERNFHCWNFRRFLLSLLLGDFPPMQLLDSGVSRKTRLLSLHPQISCEGSSVVVSLTDVKEILLLEWKFTTHKIQDNFSNFSAFHYRSSLLCEITREHLGSDWDLVENAVFTDPFEYVH
jgi:geranylgeranyl transferase type-2 subunit alpha